MKALFEICQKSPEPSFWTVIVSLVLLIKSVRKVVLRNFAKFTGKHLCESLFLNKVAGLKPQPCNFIKKETLAQVFSCEFCKISKNSSFTEHLQTTVSGISKFALFKNSLETLETLQKLSELDFSYSSSIPLTKNKDEQ